MGTKVFSAKGETVISEGNLGDLAYRYARAIQCTAPRLAAAAHGLVEGYWIDEHRFFFVAERLHPAGDLSVPVPAVFDVISGQTKTLVEPQVLKALLSIHANATLDLETLSEAEFDMPRPDTLVVSLRGEHYLINLHGMCVRERKASLGLSTLYSPDGRYACWLREHDLWLSNRETGAEQALTTDGEPLYAYGQESETSLSAVSYRHNPNPVGLWSPDSQWLLTQRMDDRRLPELALVQHAPPGQKRPILHRYKYSIPGDAVPAATPVAIHVSTGHVVSFDDFAVPVTAFSPFVFRRVWFGKSDSAWILRLDRYCKQADLIRLNLLDGTGDVIVTEKTSRGYLDLHPTIVGTPNVRTLAESDEVIWFSERDGWGHLYLYDASTGVLKNRITSGEWLVRDIVHVDEHRRRVLFLAGGIDPEADPARRSLCAVNLDGSGFEVLMKIDGDVFVPKTEPCGLDQDRAYRPSTARPGISPIGQFAVVRSGNVANGNRTEILDLHTGQRSVIAQGARTGATPLPRHVTASAGDGKTLLHGVLFLPPGFSESQQYALIDYIYPGPQLAHQPQWHAQSSSAPATALAELGFVTLMLDTRGIPGRSREFHQVGYPELLQPQLTDHVSVVKELCSRYRFLDPARVGILGHSAGGAAAARALLDYPDTFNAAVAVCGNHDPSLYAAVWSDKYRGPHEPARWSVQANQTVAHRLARPLLLVSGDMDENVHMSQTLSLADALIRANRDFELLIVPNEGHTILMTHGYTQRRIWDFFVRHLLGCTPPAEFAVSFTPEELARYGKRSWMELRQ